MSPHTWAQALSTSPRWALAILAGLLNGAAFVWIGPLALLGNIPLLIALSGPIRARLALPLGGIVGLLAGLHIYGILDYGAALLIGFGLFTGSQMMLYAWLYKRLWGKLGPTVDVLLPALIWALTEWIRTLGPLAMPASYVGCIADTPLLRPWLALASLTGGLGVSTIIALTQSVLYHAIFHHRTHRRPLVVISALILAAGGLGLLIQSSIEGTPLRVAGVQGGLANAQYKAAKADPSTMRDIVRTYEVLTQQAYAQGYALVVWPETAIRLPVLDIPELKARLLPPVGSRSILIAGLSAQTDGVLQNLAVAVGPGGVELDRYAKIRLIPRTEDRFTPGPEWRPLKTPVGQIGAMICFESIYPEVARTLTANGAEVLVVMSNDAGFGRSPITRHLTQRAIVRAVENGRWLLRVGQAGISTMIDPIGQVYGELPLFRPGLKTGTLARRTKLTLYTRWGEWWMLIIGLALLLLLWREHRGSDRVAHY